MRDHEIASYPTGGSALPTRASLNPLTGTLARDREGALILRLQHRDPAAFEELYYMYGRLAYSLIHRIVHDHGITEDLVQDTFLRVWRRADLFNSERGPIVPWLVTIARNRALDHLRSSNRRNLRLEEAADLKTTADLEERVWVLQTISLRNALQTLSATQRAVINLAYFEGYSQTEIANKLGYPLGTVKTWVRTALRILRDELRKSS